MPTLKDFGSCLIQMYFKDHNPPHVHVVSPDETALVRIRDGVVIEGKIKPALLKRSRVWIEANRDELLKKWNAFQK